MIDKITSWYNGYKGEEYPLSFLHQGQEKKVKRLIEMKLVEEEKTKIRHQEFLVETEYGEFYLITRGEETKIKKI